MSEIRTITSLDDLRVFSKELVSKIKPPQLILMDGDLGTGKTQLVRFISESLGVPSEEMSSPSFSLIHSYTGRWPISHIDLYRLKKEEDLESIGLWDVFNQSQLIFIEWANHIDKKNWPKNWNQMSVTFSWTKEGFRKVILES